MIIVKITDGLGNQMFQYAYARALKTTLSQKIYLDISDINNLRNKYATETGWIDLCDKRKYQLGNFLISLPVISKERLPKRNDKIRKKNKFLRYCEELRLLPNVFVSEVNCRNAGIVYQRYQNYYVEGGFFNKCYYEGIENILRQEFQLKDSLHIPEELEQIMKSCNTVSLHIRRGDFLRVGRNLSESDYYIKAVNYIRDKVRNPYLLIFSDDVEWVKNNIDFDVEYMIISGKGFSDCEELTLMSMCKNNIIANSTFSYWGALLNSNEDKIVISPRGWRPRIILDTWVQL